MLRVAVVDSGINPFHSHVKNVAGGISFVGEDLELELQWLDRIGHGTAVAAAICEKAPDIEMYAVKIFDRSFSTRIDLVVESLEWCAAQKMDLVNLSVATARSSHADVLKEASQHIDILVAPFSFAGVPAYPGSFPWVFGVTPDSRLERNRYSQVSDGHFRASPFPRELPEVTVQQNFSGSSFAVANLTGVLCRLMVDNQVHGVAELRRLLAA